MLIVFFTRERSVCQLIAGKLTEKGHLAFVFTNMQKLIRAMEKQEEQKVDLLALDFRIGEQRDPGWALLVGDSKVPVIFYNDPYSLPGSFAVNWNNKIIREKEFANRNLMPLFEDLESVMIQKDILPCISLVCPPQKVTNREEREIKAFDIERFREKHSVQPAKFKLLHYFYKNKDLALDAERLCLFMWDEYSMQKKGTLFSYISYLRKVFNKESDYCLRIISNGKSRYVFRISCPKFRLEGKETASDYIRPSAKSSFDF